METITYTSKDLDGIVEKPATGISDAQAVQKLLDAYNVQGEIIESLRSEVTRLSVALGLAQSKAGEIVDLGDFSQYVKDEAE